MKTLETDRLILRRFTRDDFVAIHSYASNIENIIYMPWGPNTEQQTRDFIDMAISRSEEKPCRNYHFAATLKETGELIGGCSLTLAGDSGEVGWILHSDYWRQGYGTEMGRALLSLGFDDLKLHRIVAYCDAENYGSYRVMEKIGMRREGLLIEGRAGNKRSDSKYADGLAYAILRDEWETQKDIAYYISHSVSFDDFIDLPALSDGEVFLVCMAKKPADPEKKYVPAYDFAICRGGEQIGVLNLRVGYAGYGPDSSSLYYGGQIGYSIDEKYRGNGYAARACRLLQPVVRTHGMKKLLITNNVTNKASMRVCEKLGARHVRVARLPEWIDLYKEGQRFMNIYEWIVE